MQKGIFLEARRKGLDKKELFCFLTHLWNQNIYDSKLCRNKKSQYRGTDFNFCDPDRIRTCDRLLRRQMLYPAELRDQRFKSNAKIEHEN